ncbi:MAG TPA: zinc ribbon domain-containing protein [Coriobacteriia bacterium]
MSKNATRLWCTRCSTWRDEGPFCVQCGTALARRCRSCGAVLAETDAFCTACGTPAGAAKGRRAGPPKRAWVVLLTAWGIALVVTSIAGAAWGWLSAAAGSPGGSATGYPTSDQREILKQLGEPRLFVVSDGPVTPGAGARRLETWMYADEGKSYTFLDGRLLGSQDIMADAFPPSGSGGVSPTDLVAGLKLAQVEALLGEKGTPVGDVDSPYPDCTVYDFAKHRLAVSFLSAGFFTAQSH